MRVMTSMYLMNGAPSNCQFCSQPFPIKEGHREAFHSRETNGYFCDVFCAQDALDAHARRLKEAS